MPIYIGGNCYMCCFHSKRERSLHSRALIPPAFSCSFRVAKYPEATSCHAFKKTRIVDRLLLAIVINKLQLSLSSELFFLFPYYVRSCIVTPSM